MPSPPESRSQSLLGLLDSEGDGRHYVSSKDRELLTTGHRHIPENMNFQLEVVASAVLLKA